MQPLNFPRTYAFDIRTEGGKEEIFDPLRRKYVRLTPEEWVRQNLVQHLIQDLGYPRGLTAVETGFVFRDILHRADVLVHTRQGDPILMAECKAPDVKITQHVFDQIARYNSVIQARYLILTNGLTHYCLVIDRKQRTCRSLQELPRYKTLQNPASDP